MMAHEPPALARGMIGFRVSRPRRTFCAFVCPQSRPTRLMQTDPYSPALASDKPGYGNQVGRARTGLTQIPVNGRFGLAHSPTQKSAKNLLVFHGPSLLGCVLTEVATHGSALSCVDQRQEDHASQRARASVVHATVCRATGAVCSLVWLYRETNRQASRAGATEACEGAPGGVHGERRCWCAHDPRRSWRGSAMPWAISCVCIADTGSITSAWSWTGGAVSP